MASPSRSFSCSPLSGDMLTLASLETTPPVVGINNPLLKLCVSTTLGRRGPIWWGSTGGGNITATVKVGAVTRIQCVWLSTIDIVPNGYRRKGVVCAFTQFCFFGLVSATLEFWLHDTPHYCNVIQIGVVLPERPKRQRCKGTLGLRRDAKEVRRWEMPSSPSLTRRGTR